MTLPSPEHPAFLRSLKLDATPSGASICEQVASCILALVKAGRLKSGDRLPTELQMAKAFGISRPPLREALKALALMGVIESRQGGRYTITDLSPSRLVEPFNLMLSSRAYDPVDHDEARRTVDLDCVRRCAERAPAELKAHILQLSVDGPRLVDDSGGFHLLDRDFHGSIYAGSGNVFLETVARGLFEVGLALRRGGSLRPDVIAVSCEDHRQIALSIAAGDGEGAVDAYRRHLDHIRVTVVETLRVQNAERP